MYRFDPEHYLNSPDGLLAQHRRRALRRVHFSIDGVEPRAKHSMPDGDKDEVQKQLLKQLVDLRRNAFQGPLALRLRLATTEKVPTHSHHIAKNLLDLFGTPRTSLATRRRSLLYADDNQVHALVVTCRHGQSAPMISVVANRWAACLPTLISPCRPHGTAPMIISNGSSLMNSIGQWTRSETCYATKRRSEAVSVIGHLRR